MYRKFAQDWEINPAQVVRKSGQLRPQVWKRCVRKETPDTLELVALPLVRLPALLVDRLQRAKSSLQQRQGQATRVRIFHPQHQHARPPPRRCTGDQRGYSNRHNI